MTLLSNVVTVKQRYKVFHECLTLVSKNKAIILANMHNAAL